MILQNRDREILGAAYEQQFLRLELIQGVFFSGSYGAMWVRLDALRTAGYVTIGSMPDFPKMGILRLTTKGRRVTEEGRGFRITQKREIAVSTFVHDSIVSAVRFRLRQFWDAHWIPERALRADDYPQVPDGILLFASGKKVAIEVENSSKTKTRYLRLWSKWRNTQTSLVLYVATSPALAGALRRLLPEAPKDVAFGLVEWSALKGGKPPIWTPHQPLDLFSRRTL